MGLKSKLFLTLTASFSKETATFLMAMLPIFELRLAIPAAVLYLNMSVFQAFIISLAGNIAIIIPLLYFFKYFFHILENLWLIGKFFRWWFRSVEKRSKIVEKWGFWGLVCFVAIPLPGTGAWAGSVASTLFELRIKKGFTAIAIGVTIAAVIVTFLTILFQELVKTWFISI